MLILGGCMTNDEYKVIFLHFVKTGGSSIEDYFGVSDGYKETKVTLSDKTRKIVKEQHHFSASQYKRTNGEKVWNDKHIKPETIKSFEVGGSSKPSLLNASVTNTTMSFEMLMSSASKKRCQPGTLERGSAAACRGV